MRPTPDGRPLDGPEDTLRRIDQAVPLNFCVVAEVEGPLTDQALRAGLKALQARHPLLRVGFAAEGPPAFAPLDAPLPMAVCVQPEPAWTGAIVEELAQPFTAGPLARARWIRHGDARSRVVLTFHHSVNDGHGGMFALRDLLAGAAAHLDGAAAPADPLPLPTPMMARIPSRFRGFRVLWPLLTAALRDLGRLLRVGPARGLVPERPCDVVGRTLHVVTRAVEPEVTARLVARARQERTTVHGALLAALGQALAAERGRAVTLALGSPVDLRKRLDPPAGEAVGLFVGMISSAARVDPAGDLWALARRLRDDVKRDADRGLPFALHRLMGLVARWWQRGHATPQTLARRLYHFVPACSGLSNLGRLGVPGAHGPLAVRGLQLFIHPSALGDFVGTAAEFAGVLHLCFSAMAPAVSPERAARLVDATVARLRAACEVA
ncbi:MAG: hypothetical protein H6706_30055 [Myxococcales bacterium]|nr:hypothetical protein [Myxococcales bacterium]